MKRTSVDFHAASRLNISGLLSREDLERARQDALEKTVRYAVENCRFYRKRYGRIDVRQFFTAANFEKIPFMDSSDLRQSGHELLCVSQARVARVVTMQTSGSTGSPKRLFFTQNDLQATIDFFFAGMQSLIQDGDRVLVLLPWQQPASVGGLLIRALTEGGIYAQGCWPPESLMNKVEYLRNEELNCVVGLPQHLLELSESVPPGVLASMLLCSDYCPPSLRKRIEDNCGCETFLHYGSTESGLGGAVECSAHDGCHVRESDLFVEIIDPVTGRRLPEGERGELVLTTIAREAMPLIRYRTGDIGALLRGKCHCGGVTARLISLSGRLQPCRLAGGGLLCSQELDDRLYTIPGLLDYRAALVSDGHDRLEISYTSVPGVSSVGQQIADALAEIPGVVKGGQGKEVTIGKIVQVECFGADHTLKRTLSDKRNPGCRQDSGSAVPGQGGE